MSFPIEALNQHVAILGMTGSGKTTTAKGFAENLLDAGKRVCVIDPTGVWWGLRLKADGKSPAYPMVLFGGMDADIPVTENTNAHRLAEIIGKGEFSCIVDASRKTFPTVAGRTRFFTDLAEALPGSLARPMHLIIDEAHLFMPKGKVDSPQSGRMLNYFNALVSGGRSGGFRIILISQRPAKLHNDSLTQAPTVIAMRVTSHWDRKAVMEFLEDCAEPAKCKEIRATLPFLDRGEGWVWIPQKHILDRMKFPNIKTLDTSAAPEDDEEILQRPTDLGTVDLAGIREALREQQEEEPDDSPSEELLKAEYDRGYNEGLSEGRAEVNEDQTAEAEKAGYDRGFAAGVESSNQWWRDRLAELRPSEGQQLLPDGKIAVPGTTIGRWQTDKPNESAPPRKQSPFIDGGKYLPERNGALPKGELAVLSAIAQTPAGILPKNITVLTGYKSTSRNTYLQRLGAQKYIRRENGFLIATAEGRKALGKDFKPLPTGRQLREYWLQKLPLGERTILEWIIRHHPKPVTRSAICPNEYKATSRNTYLQRLSARQLIESAERGQVRAARILFDG